MFTAKELIGHLEAAKEHYSTKVDLYYIVRHCWSCGTGMKNIGVVCSHFGYSPVQCWKDILKIHNRLDAAYELNCRLGGHPCTPVTPFKLDHMPYGLSLVAQGSPEFL